MRDRRVPRTPEPDRGTSRTAHNHVPVPVLIIGGHPLFSTALRMALRAEDIEAHQIPMADPATVLATTSHFPVGLVLLDLTTCYQTPAQAMRGADLVVALREQGKRTVLLSGGHDNPTIEAGPGTVDTLPLSLPFESLLNTLALAATGDPTLSAIDRRDWIADDRQLPQQLPFAQRMQRLSPLEHQILRMLADGCRAAAIARQSVVPLDTVRSQIRAILTKLQVNSQLEAVALLFDRRHRDDRAEVDQFEHHSSTNGAHPRC
jgi:DNA-binding NarL/FixJ family response regulator